MQQQQLNDNNGMIAFTSIGGYKFYGLYDPQKTTLKQIRVTLLLNYTCNTGNDVQDKNIDLTLECGFFSINIGDVDQDYTMDKLYHLYDMVNNNKIPKFIKITQNHDPSSNANYALSKELREKIKNSTFQVFISTLSGKTFSLKALPYLGVGQLKELICDVEGIPVDQQRLVFNGKQINDELNLSDYNIQKEANIQLILRLRGGMFHETSGKNGNYGKLANSVFRIDPDII